MLSEACALPCSFQPGTDETVEWFRQDVSLYKFERNGSNTNYFKQQELAERASVSVPQVSNGNASLVLRRCGVKDRGTYRCHVRTSAGVHNARVILKVEGELMLDEDKHSSVITFDLSQTSVFLLCNTVCSHFFS